MTGKKEENAELGFLIFLGMLVVVGIGATVDILARCI